MRCVAPSSLQLVRGMFLSHGSYRRANVGFRCERGPFKQLRPSRTGKVLASKTVSFETPEVITATAGPGAGRSMADIANMDIAELAKDPVYVGLVLGLFGIVAYFALGRKSFGPVPSKLRTTMWAQWQLDTFQMTSPLRVTQRICNTLMACVRSAMPIKAASFAWLATLDRLLPFQERKSIKQASV